MTKIPVYFIKDIIPRKINLQARACFFMESIDKIVDKLLNDQYMTPAKIKAFSYVIQALKGISVQEPNEVKDEENDKELTEDQPLDFSEIQGIQVDSQPRGKVKIYKT